MRQDLAAVPADFGAGYANCQMFALTCVRSDVATLSITKNLEQISPEEKLKVFSCLPVEAIVDVESADSA
jgi:hypothetical protein